ncbi:SurA N-terminal domain-containing protein [Leisingera sp. HS039]|uniref:peptidylprolyl isomerase n=1 Tax=unclassified Leisingera TaxID=2614906 RepID=UPI0010713C50|nr:MULTISPECIES: peptidylprolyl isomerase [unclassified Leisingera]MBQ4826436.1 SurA N-terminal domain-containing protein [Leisingera sp. HS039]QBR36449.1 peptidylprolyl isomerase [Leisingera sp. NJS201]
MAAGMKKLSKTFVWILMGMLIVGLAGFGAVNFTSSASSVASVGDEEVSIGTYVRELQREQRGLQAQTGQAVSMAQLSAFGLDRVVLGRLISLAALDHEAKGLGLSIGDENLIEELGAIDAFQGVNGAFDREAYSFALRNAGLSEKEFEEDLRREAARTIVQNAVLSGTEMPGILTETLTGFIGARRSFSYVQINAADIALTAQVPADAELQAFYEAAQDQFMLPETKVITYAALRPSMLLDEVEIDEAALRQLFNDRSSQYQVPERRLVERLVFADDDAAASAKAQLETGGATFESLVDARGLTLQDIDMGDVTMGALGAAGTDVFAAQVGDVEGPLPSDLGPALYRVNGRLEAQITTFEQAMPDLREELASDRTRRLVEAQAEDIDDLLAGGATLEELATESGLELVQIHWTDNASDGIAAYEGFRTAAAAVTAEDFPAVDFLDDGSLFALRLDEVLPERPEPFADAKDKVLAAWQADRLATALREQGETLLAQAESAGGFAEGAEVKTETGLTRTAYIDTVPADLVTQVFEMEVGNFRLLQDAESAVAVRLDGILPPEASDDMNLLTQALQAQLNQALAQELFQAYVQDVQARAEPRVDQQALNAAQANFQ